MQPSNPVALVFNWPALLRKQRRRQRGQNSALRKSSPRSARAASPNTVHLMKYGISPLVKTRGGPHMARVIAELPKGTRLTDYISLGVLSKTFPVSQVKTVLAEQGKASQRSERLPGASIRLAGREWHARIVWHAPGRPRDGRNHPGPGSDHGAEKGDAVLGGPELFRLRVVESSASHRSRSSLAGEEESAPADGATSARWFLTESHLCVGA